MTLARQETLDALKRARENTQRANANYKKTWRENPTARGWAKVDVALEALNQAEANERAIEAELGA